MPPKPPLTHFLCLPLCTPSSRCQLQASLHRFTAEETTPDEEGNVLIPPKAIRPPGAIHFTLGVMSLQTEDRIEAASEFLKGLDIRHMLKSAASEPLQKESNSAAPSTTPRTKVTTDQPPTTATPAPNTSPSSPAPPLSISLISLHPLPHPSAASTLYATPTPTHPLHPFALSLHTAFTTAGFLLPETRPLLLHATLANTIYARKSPSGKNRWMKGSGKFDSRGVLERWGDAVWVEGMRVERVAICEMGVRKIEGLAGGEEGYKEVAGVELP